MIISGTKLKHLISYSKNEKINSINMGEIQHANPLYSNPIRNEPTIS